MTPTHHILLGTQVNPILTFPHSCGGETAVVTFGQIP